MIISEAMLDAAILKATEAGLLGRQATESEKAFNRAVIRAVIEAALREQVGGNALHAPSTMPRNPDRWSFFSCK